MRHIPIKAPIWQTQSVGVAQYKITDDLEITIEYRNKEGEKLYPYRYFITKEKALTYPTQTWKGTLLRIIPIRDLEIIKPAKKQLEDIRAYFVSKGVFRK